MPAQPKPEKDEPVAIPLDPEEALRALLRVKPDVKHSVHRGMTLMAVKCEGCGAPITEQRRVGRKLWMYCPNDPDCPPRPGPGGIQLRG
jgi:hypothetical protein